MDAPETKLFVCNGEQYMPLDASAIDRPPFQHDAKRHGFQGHGMASLSLAFHNDGATAPER